MGEKFKILNFNDQSFIRDSFKALEEIAFVTHETAEEQKLLRLIPEYHAYICSLAVRVTREVIDAGRNLRVIATPSTGLDHIDVAYAKQRGIEILSLKDDYDFLRQVSATAEHAFGLLLGVVRKIPWSFDAAKSGEWARDRYRGMQLRGKTFGILGYGRLGEMTAEYARAFGMEVIACDIKNIHAQEVTQVDFYTLLAQSDILSVHIHLTPENQGILDTGAFERMKKGIVLINTSRGAIINEKALLQALESGHVVAAGLDVIDGEWREDLYEHPLIQYACTHENLLITPHLGGVTYESQKMAYEHTINKLYDYLMKI